MASEFSFDVESKVDYNLVEESIANANREISNRYDFRGSNSTITLDKKENHIMLVSSDDYKVKALFDVLLNKFSKRNVPMKNFKPQKAEASLGGQTKQLVKIQQGIPQEKAKEMVKLIKERKFKATAAIKGDTLRVSSKSKNELQEIMSFLGEKDFGVSLQFANYR